MLLRSSGAQVFVFATGYSAKPHCSGNVSACTGERVFVMEWYQKYTPVIIINVTISYFDANDAANNKLE